MQFVQGLPQGVYVGQTRVYHEQVQPSAQSELGALTWLCMSMMMRACTEASHSAVERFPAFWRGQNYLDDTDA